MTEADPRPAPVPSEDRAIREVSPKRLADYITWMSVTQRSALTAIVLRVLILIGCEEMVAAQTGTIHVTCSPAGRVPSLR